MPPFNMICLTILLWLDTKKLPIAKYKMIYITLSPIQQCNPSKNMLPQAAGFPAKKTYMGTSCRWTLRRKMRRLPTARLGGKKPRRFFLGRLYRRAKLKCLKLKYLSMLKNVRKYYDSFVKEMIDGSRAIESFQQKMLLEASFAVPVMGLNFTSTYPSRYA